MPQTILTHAVGLRMEYANNIITVIITLLHSLFLGVTVAKILVKS